MWSSRVRDEARGVVTSLAYDMRVWAKRSLIYQCWEKKKKTHDNVSTLRKQKKGSRSLRENRWAKTRMNFYVIPLLSPIMIMS